MQGRVQLNEIVDALDMQIDEYSSYLNLDTGSIETIADALLQEADNNPDAAEPDVMVYWEPEEWQIAKRIVSTDRFVSLPSRFDIHEYSIIERFALSREGEQTREELLHAIRGRGAFRSFKDTIRRLGIEQAWFEFRHEAFKEIAVEWCEEHKIAYE